MVNGTFDILHPGHMALLNTARDYGDYLVVAIDTDRRVREIKGEQRPVNNQHDRKIMLSNLKAVDIVEFFDSREELVELIRIYKPDVYVKGSDWKSDKASIQEQCCKKIVYYDRLKQYSTTQTIQDIISRG